MLPAGSLRWHDAERGSFHAKAQRSQGAEGLGSSLYRFSPELAIECQHLLCLSRAMNYWCFKFEGRIVESVAEPGFRGVFSKCLVPDEDYSRALDELHRALKEEGIELVEITETFDYDGFELDDSEDTAFWKEWYIQARDERGPVFDVWHVFPEDSEQ